MTEQWPGNPAVLNQQYVCMAQNKIYNCQINKIYWDFTKLNISVYHQYLLVLDNLFHYLDYFIL